LVEPNTAVTAKWGVPGLKAAMERLPFLKGAYLRSPLLPLNKEERRNFNVILQKAEISKALKYELY
jgi:4-hydroxy-2-oxoglutarate aldolase